MNKKLPYNKTMKDIYKLMCLNIAKARIRKGISAYELSRRIGMDESYCNKLENGNMNLTIKVLFAICKELDVEPYTLFIE